MVAAHTYPGRRRVGRRAVTAAVITAGLVAVGVTTVPATAAGDSPAPLQDALVGWATVDGTTTGGAGGETVTVTSGDQLISEIQADGPRVVQVEGTISLSGMNNVASDKTIVGAGSNATITGGGLDLNGVSNVIIQNLNFRDWDDDAINVQESSHHVWIDHNSFSNGSDGAVDIKRESDFITVSWNHVFDHDHSMLLGHSDSHTADIGFLRVTYHHNWFDGTESRHPRVRFGDAVHVYNNYYVGNEHGVASTMEAGVLVEGNYFESVAHPTHVGYASSGPGRLVERNNVYDGSGEPEAEGSVTEPSTFYNYDLDDAASVPGIVRAGAGAGNI